MQLSATDPNGDTLTFSISSGSGTTPFSIEASSGLISVASHLDYETTSSYTLYIIVDDGMSQVATTVTITVLDVPEILYHVECDPLVLSVVVTEDTPAMTNTTQRLACLDPDHSDASFTLSSTGGLPISLDEMGFVILTIELDYELQALHTVTASFIDQNGNAAVGSATVVISVLPINEYPPHFNETMMTTISIAESAPPATSLGQVVATDADDGSDGQVTYGVAGGNGSLHFTVHPSTGVIISIAPLDYEASTQYWLVITATDSPTNISTALSTNVTFTILVTDENDNNPLFSKHIYRASISEDAAGSNPVLQVYCTDDDTGINQAVTYSILDDTVIQFNTEETSGEIQVGAALDYESSQQYLFTVQCTDSGVPPLSSIAMVIIELLSANEFTPTFATSSVVYNVPEDTLVGTELGQLVASDGDGGLAGLLSFGVLHSDTYCPNHLIQIDAQSGKLYLTGSLDYESATIPQLLCQVQAMDSQEVVRTGTIDVLIVIININDNPPQCDRSVITITVPEDTAVSSSLDSFSCSDPDASSLSYTLVPYSSLVSLDTTTGSSVQLLLSEALDYENETNHHFTVLVTDGTFNATIKIFIEVEEANEYSPVFTQDEYHCTVSEMIAPGTLLSCVVTATDSDNGHDGELHYAITASSPVNNYFTINSSTGVIIVTRTIDYESDPLEFSLTVTSMDHSLTAVRSSNATVIITLLDLNDNVPVMDSSSIFTISEAADIGSIVGATSCSDADSGSNGAVTYSILSTNLVLDNVTLYPVSSPLPYIIDNSTGIIKTTATLDYEATSAYQLQLECADLGSPQHAIKTVAIISVEPVNEFSPSIDFPPPGLSLVINPLIDAVGSTLITISATDQDKGNDGIVTYSIELIDPLSESHVQILAVNSNSGALGLISLPSCALGDELMYRITATDGGDPPLNTSTDVTVLVLQSSCDSLPPSSSTSLYAASMIETASVNTTVVQVSCTNPNLMSSLTIKYMIITNSTQNNVFSIDEDTGQMRVAATLDYEQAHQVLVNVRCYYSDDASLSTDVSVYINIMAVNEYDPVFNMPAMIQVNEDTPPGAVVMTALATDADEGEDGRVTYTLVTEGPFDVDKFNGNVYLISTLDRETSDEYLLEIEAHDNAPDRRASSASVSVLVMDSNDNYPQCPQLLYRITISQDTVPGATLVQLNCTDLDEGSNGKLMYAIIGSQQTIPITMNETNGVLSLIEPATISNAPRQQTLAVGVTDSGISPLSITVHLFITLDLEAELVTNRTEDAVVAEAQQNTVTVTIDRVDSKSVSLIMCYFNQCTSCCSGLMQ